MKKKNAFKKNFIIISATFIIGLLFAYTTRLVHFYLKENKKNNGSNDVSVTYFTDVLENTINVSDVNGGLYLDQNAYMYKYNADQNYLLYSGQLWRIIRINDDKTVKLISDEAISLVHPKYEEQIYMDDYLKEFYEKLDDELLVEFDFCNDQITDVKNITCETNQKGFITLLDMNTYSKVGNVKSFLNNKTVYWLNNKDKDGNYWYVDAEGNVGIGNETIAHNLRPVVTLKSEIELKSGDGSKENPYVIKESKASTLSEVVIGEYIKYNESLWRILAVNEKSVSALKVECIKDNDECVKSKFGTGISYLNSTIYKYLNEKFYESLEDKDFLVKDTFYNGVYKDYDFKALKNNTVEAYIGLPRVGEYYITGNVNSYLITPNVIETVYTLNELGNYYLIEPSAEKTIYPIINLDIELKIKDGNGNMDNPYVLSR